MILGRQLRALRDLDGLTLKEVAAAVGVSDSSVHAYEAGEVRVPWEVLAQLSVLYGTSLDLLCKHAKDKHRERLLFLQRKYRNRRERAA